MNIYGIDVSNSDIPNRMTTVKCVYIIQLYNVGYFNI